MCPKYLESFKNSVQGYKRSCADKNWRNGNDKLTGTGRQSKTLPGQFFAWRIKKYHILRILFNLGSTYSQFFIDLFLIHVLTLISTFLVLRLNLICKCSFSTIGVNIFIQFSFKGVYLWLGIGIFLNSDFPP